MMMSREFPYLRVDEDMDRCIEERQAQAARDRLDPGEVLAEVQRRLLGIVDEDRHPLWPLVKHCTEVGTTRETGRAPYMAEWVGAALEPVIEQAIARLVREALDDDAAWEVA